jgi:hypothetical protein
MHVTNWQCRARGFFGPCHAPVLPYFSFIHQKIWQIISPCISLRWRFQVLGKGMPYFSCYLINYFINQYIKIKVS